MVPRRRAGGVSRGGEGFERCREESGIVKMLVIVVGTEQRDTDVGGCGISM